MSIEFGVILHAARITPSIREIKEIALAADKLGFHSLWSSDHMMHPFDLDDKLTYYCHEAWTMMTALGALTENVKIGFNVLVPTFRHPSVLAKMATTLDILTDGRLIMCLGSGWFKREYEAYGIPWDEDHDERIEREREAILLMKTLWTEKVANFDGRFYQIKDAIMEPKPVQKPYPHIWIGGRSPKSRELIAELANGWLLFGREPEENKQNIDSMQEMIGEKQLDYAIALERVSTDHTDKCITVIQEYIDTGANLLNLPFYSIESITQFANEVLPSFKKT